MQYRYIPLTPRFRLAITEAGMENSETLVVLVHGWCGHREDWNPTIARLQNNHSILSIDLPGHGDSTEQKPPGWTVRDMATVLADALKLWSNSPMILVGHSMGGAVALEAARQLRQVRSVILVDTFILPYGDISEEDARKIEQPFFENFPKAVDEMVESFMAPMAPALQKESIKRRMSANDPAMMLPLWSDLLRWSPDSAFAALDLPLHAINGDMIPTAAHSRCAEYVTEWHMPKAGHFPHIEMPEPFHQLLNKIIAG